MVRLCLFAPLVLLAFSLAVGAVGKEGTNLKADYKALQGAEGLWIKDGAKGLTELRIESKEFPKLLLSINELVRAEKDFDGQASFKVKVNAILQEKDGKGVLVIEGKSITYSFERNGDFLVLSGRFEYSKKNVNLTGKWSAANTKK